MSVPSRKFFLVALIILMVAVTIPLIAQAAFSLSLNVKPFGGKISAVTPNPPPTPLTPNPCYDITDPGSELVIIGLSVYVLPSSVNVINGTALPSEWSLGLADRTGVCPTITLMGVSGIF
jgi:hypothetical protein